MALFLWSSKREENEEEEKLIKKELPFHSLSPTIDTENSKNYLKALRWALEPKNEIKNIALTGPYGSGKSSILKTFQNECRSEEYKFLNISLATFEDKKDNSDNKNNDDLLRLIELSILQQIFYHVKDKEIPFSRFKKITNYNTKYFIWFAMGFVIFIISLSCLFFPGFIPKYLDLHLSKVIKTVLRFSTMLYVAISLSFFSYEIIRLVRGLKIKKLFFKDAEIEIEGPNCKSILNHHIDEILYFFEVTDYNIVIIEDLERFEQTEIFTKLREINLLINNSKQIDRPIVFIYAIRDDLFKDRNRTKFFDFIIPVIPVINSSNSKEKLLKIVEENEYSFSKELIEDISLFIDDMRLLNNIMNEYHLYSKNLKKVPSQDNLLAMIVYKNLYPEDFTQLSKSTGNLYKIISQKQIFVTKEIQRLKNEADLIENDINQNKSLKISDIVELRILYISKIVDRIISQGKPFLYFYVSNKRYNIEKAAEEDIFKLFLTGNINYQTSLNYPAQQFQYNFSDIEREVCLDMSYKERENKINDFNRSKINTLRQKIDEIEKEIENLKKCRLKDIIENNIIQISSQQNIDKNQLNLLGILLRNGYINEDYLDYISIFYEGSITRSDHQFLINVKSQNSSDFEYKLHKIEELVNKINPFDFEKEYILNYDLLDFILSNHNYIEIKDRLIGLLTRETENTIDFIKGYIEITPYIKEFIESLCRVWLRIWERLKNRSNFDDNKDKYFRLIIEYAQVEDISEIFSEYKTQISSYKSFLTIIDDSEKIKKIIENLDIKFTDLEIDPSKDDMLDYVFENNHYEINPLMINLILRHYTNFDIEEINSKNYTTIKQSKLDPLIKYIDDNIEEYVTKVFLALESNVSENSEQFADLLNNEEISLEKKELMIKKIDTQIDDIKRIKEDTIIKLLYINSKVFPHWKNIMVTYLKNDKTITKAIISYINEVNNSKVLSQKYIRIDYPDKETAKIFIEAILLENSISDVCYNYILNSILYIYLSLGFEKLSITKIELLIKKNKLSLTTSNFDKLKAHFASLHITLIELKQEDYFKDIEKFEVDEKDISNLLKSNKITKTNKETIINFYFHETPVESPVLLLKIGNLLLANKISLVPYDIVKSVLEDSRLDLIKRIRYFVEKNKSIPFKDFSNIIKSFDQPYSDIAINGKRPLINKTKLNMKFVNLLLDRNYISKYELEKRKIRISTYRNPRY